MKMVFNDLDDVKEQSEKIAAVKKQTQDLADKTVQLHKVSCANQRQKLIHSAHVGDLRCSMARMVAENEAACKEIDTLQHANQSKVNSEIAQIQRQFEVTLTEHKKQVQGLLSQLKEPSDVDTDFDVKARSSLVRRVGTAQNELLKSQIANAVLVERLNLDLLKWGRVPDAIRDAIDKLHDEIWADQAKKALREITKSYSESAKTLINELGLREIQRVTTAGVQRSPAEAGDGAAPAIFNFVPTTLHLSHEEIQRGMKLRPQAHQNMLGPVTTEPKPIVDVRTDVDDTCYEDRGGDESLTDQDGGQLQPSSCSVAVDAKASSKRPRNDVDGPPSAPQAKKSASDTDYTGKRVYQGPMKVVLAPIQGWLSSGGLFRPSPATQPKADDTSFEREDQRQAIMLMYKAHIAWKVVNVETSPNKFITPGHLGRERRLE